MRQLKQSICSEHFISSRNLDKFVANLFINFVIYCYMIAQAVSRWLPTAAALGWGPDLVMWDLWWSKWRRGRFSPSTSVSPANLHSTNCSTILIYLGFVQ
jgi:hypothetical protein